MTGKLSKKKEKNFLVLILIGIFIIALSYQAYLVLAAPSPITSVVLNSTTGFNYSGENLNVNVLPAANSTQNYFYNWYLNGAPFTLVNIPMDGGANFTGGTVREYVNDYGLFVSNNTGANYSWNNGRDSRGAYNFDGKLSYLAPAFADILGFEGSKDITVSAWIFKNDKGSIFGKGDNWNHNGYELYINNLHYLCFMINNVSCCGYLFNGTSRWHHVVGTYNGSEIAIYVDGNFSAKTSYNASISTSANVFSIGYQGSFYNSLNGIIDDVLVFNRSLSVAEIQALYQDKKNFMAGNETKAGDVWQVQVYPNDNTADGTPVWSNSITIQNGSFGGGCPPTPQNWVVDLSTNPIINSLCNLTGYNVTLAGTGNLTVNSTFYMKYLKGFSAGRRILMKPAGKIRMKVA